MELPDPRKVDWPLPPPQDGASGSLREERLQVAAEEIRRALASLSAEKSEAFIDLLARNFDASPSPVDSVRALEQLLSQSAAEFVPAALDAPDAFARLFALMGHSRPLASHLARGFWREFMALAPQELARRVTAEQVVNAARERIAMGEEVRAALRKNHRDFCVRVLFHETALALPLEEIGAEISALADGALQVAAETARREVEQRRGIASSEGFRFCVIAFGKLGARELNYASDIDLMFVYDGEPQSAAGERATSGAEFAKRIGEALIPLLDEVTQDGNVFRVDTRLRPEGKRGRLALGLEQSAQYYFNFGSTLERQALIKARPCAGDIALGEELLSRVSTWVYRKYLTVGEINEIKGLKRQLEQRAEIGADTFRDIKHGFGGIRDIEFVTQFLQLLNGGRLIAIRIRDTLGALKALASNGVLKRAEADELAAAYRFLRAVEHRLQLLEGLQTYRLPEERADIERVARCLGYSQKTIATPDGTRAAGQSRAVLSEARAFINDLKAHTLRVRGLMMRLFSGLFATQQSPAESELVLDLDYDAAQAATLLKKYGLRDTALALRLIREMAEEAPGNRLYSPRTRKYLASMMPALLDFVGASPDPDFTLINFERITAKLGAKTMLFELIAEDPRALEVFGRIAAQSSWLTGLLCNRPGLIDEFIDSLQTFARIDKNKLRSELASRKAAASDALEALAFCRDVELLRIGLFDAGEKTPLPETLRELCILAEILLEAAVDQALAETRLAAEARNALCVIGLGKLGGRALNYASDLDLVFVYEPAYLPAELQPQAGAIFTRVARRVIDILSGGVPLYAVDLRLRPHGSKGNVASSVSELERYLAEEAQFWERLALTRARVLFERENELSGRVTSLLQGFAFPGALEGAAKQTREMRARVQAHASPRDLKRGSGGLHDVEFLVEYLQLTHGARLNGLRQSGIFEALEACRNAALLDEATHDAIMGAYAFLRQVTNRMQLLDGRSHDELPSGEELELLAKRLGYVAVGGLGASAQFEQELNYHRDNARRAFDAFVK